MYSLFKGLLLRWLKTPQEPPDPPRGARDSIQTFRASPKFLKYQLLLYTIRQVPGAIFSLVIGIGMFVGADEVPEADFWMRLGATFVIVSATFGTLLRYWLIRLDYDLRYYILTDRSLRIRQGAWRIEEATFTFANIQNLSIHQGPLERVLGISNVIIETAGGGGGAHPQAGAMMHRGALRGIEHAEQMRDRIMMLLKKYRDAGLGDDKPKQTSRAQPGPAASLGSLPPQTISLLRQVREQAQLFAWATRTPRSEEPSTPR